MESGGFGRTVLALATLSLSLVMQTMPQHAAAASGSTHVERWSTNAATVGAGATVQRSVRVLTHGSAVPRRLRLEVRSEGSAWRALSTQRTGKRGWARLRWTAPSQTEGRYLLRVRVLPRGTGDSQIPGALTGGRALTVQRAARHPVTAELLAAFNEARGTARRCGRDWYAAQPPLTAQADLRVAAQRHAEDMARHDYFSHTGRNGSDVEDRTRTAGYAHPSGENLAGGQATARDAVEAWLESPGHCVNIMWPHYRTIGVGFSPRVGDSTYQSYWVTNLGTR